MHIQTVNEKDLHLSELGKIPPGHLCFLPRIASFDDVVKDDRPPIYRVTDKKEDGKVTLVSITDGNIYRRGADMVACPIKNTSSTFAVGTPKLIKDLKAGDECCKISLNEKPISEPHSVADPLLITNKSKDGFVTVIDEKGALLELDELHLVVPVSRTMTIAPTLASA